LAPLVEQHNSQPEAAPILRLATPRDYEAVASPAEDGPVVRGELNPVFQGIYSSRIELKQITRELERLLTTAEKLGVLLQALGEPTTEERVWEAWERMLFNQAHDLMSGVMTDGVYEDTLHSFDCARRVAEEEVEARLRRYVAAINTHGQGLALIVFNSLGWARSDLVTAKVGFSEADVRGVRVVDPDGQVVPAQLVASERSGDGALIEAEVAFVARDVPALGHCVYRVVPLHDAESGDPLTPPDGVLENGLLRVQVAPLTGAITGLTVKDGGWQALRAPGNVVVQEEDHGDLWEPYKPLDGGSRIAMQEPHPVPPRGEAVYSDEQTGEPGRTVRGPVLSEITVSHPFGERGHFTTRVRLVAGLRRVEVRTRLLNHDEFVRYRALFPASVEGGRSVHEIPFGALERPNGIEFPAQNWIDHSDGHRGLALLNRGLPGHAVHDGTLLLSLLRCTRIVAYGFGGGYGPGMSSDSGLQLGRDLALEYALVPHAGDWRAAGLYRDGLEFNHPLIAVKAGSHDGPLPGRWGLLHVSPGNVVLSALKPSRDGTAVVRLYEAAGQPTPNVRVRLPAGVSRVEEVDLLEDPVSPLPVAEGCVELGLGAFQIKTLRFASAGVAHAV
ncbi:MAG: hypothetical protein FJX74_06215, partial [Armatimonadetes bacterium]|nr:hypothetical protein [Armatimonadota bacterium]